MNRAVLHDHLDGGLRAATASELANQINYTPLQNIDNIATFFDRSDCKSLEEYLEAFTHTIALMQSFENLDVDENSMLNEELPIMGRQRSSWRDLRVLRQ